MSKQIWIGPVLGGNRPRLVARCADLISECRADDFLYLAASHPLLDLVTRGLLDGTRNRGVWGSIPVHLFGGFVRHVLSTAVEDDTGLPVAPRVAIDRDELPLKRSLISQLVRRLVAARRVKALAPLAHRDGCINTIASLIGELQRAAKTPAEFKTIVEARIRDSQQATDEIALISVPRQIDFDGEISLVYSAYGAALDHFHMSDDDADQLHALQVLGGEVDGRRVSLPWLPQVRLLVLDGFFDFTPVQGEMLRLLIPRVPDVIVNLNRDERNPEIFRPFGGTIEQLCSIAPFDVITTSEASPVAGALSPLRERLFNPALTEGSEGAAGLATEGAAPESLARSNIRLLECGDRETEIRAIAKEVKRLVLIEGYSLADIAVVVRERASYADAITRIFDDESIACSLDRRTAVVDVPAVRAAMKLFQVLAEMRRDEARSPKVSDLADLIKSEYLRLSASELEDLHRLFMRDQEHLLSEALTRAQDDSPDLTLGIGHWDADVLENVIAYVGSDLRVDRWIERARRLTEHIKIAAAPAMEPADDADAIEESVDGDDVARNPDAEEQRSRAELPGSHRRRKPATEIHPALIAWAALVVERLAHVLGSTLHEGRPRQLRDSLIGSLEQLQFAGQIERPLRDSSPSPDFVHAALDLRGLESMRRALAAAIRAFEIAHEIAGEREASSPIKLPVFIDEVVRCLEAQTLGVTGADRDGLQVLEATDVRGLRFRAVFIAGLVEGGFPLRASRDWIYPHEERERLKQYGLTLEDISPDTLLKEEHYFYQAACRATERLYLTRPLLLQEDADTETVASYYIDEVRQAVAPERIESDVVRRDVDGRGLGSASTPSELSVSLVRQSERLLHGADRDGVLPRPVIERLISWAAKQGYLSRSALERIDIERERAGPIFGRFDGEISNAGLRSRMRIEYGPDHIFSASELSLYGKCPFKFFAQRVLKLEPRGEAALDLPALDAGRLLHEVLRRFFERHRSERLSSLDREALRLELQEVAEHVFDEHERMVPPLNPRVWAIDREIRKVLLDQVLAYEISVQGATRRRDVRPAYFELAFGMESEQADPNSTERLLGLRRPAADQDETALIRGQIDRVDVAKDGTTIAYDYKLSRGASLSDMKEGRDLQLGIYLAALEQLFLRGTEIAGGGYYVMRGAQNRRNRGLYRNELGEYTGIGSTNSNLSDADWWRVRGEMEARVWEFIDAMRAGRFAVAPSSPKDTCPTCDYSAVCRYEKFRISHKESQKAQNEDREEGKIE